MRRTARLETKGPDFLFDQLRQRADAGPVAFDFNLQLPEPGEKLDGAVMPLPAERKKLTQGRLRIK